LHIRSDEFFENPVKLLESSFLLQSSGIILVAIDRVSFVALEKAINSP
jgi:hypothetical protein